MSNKDSAILESLVQQLTAILGGEKRNGEAVPALPEQLAELSAETIVHLEETLKLGIKTLNDGITRLIHLRDGTKQKLFRLQKKSPGNGRDITIPTSTKESQPELESGKQEESSADDPNRPPSKRSLLLAYIRQSDESGRFIQELVTWAISCLEMETAGRSRQVVANSLGVMINDLKDDGLIVSPASTLWAAVVPWPKDQESTAPAKTRKSGGSKGPRGIGKKTSARKFLACLQETPNQGRRFSEICGITGLDRFNGRAAIKRLSNFEPPLIENRGKPKDGLYCLTDAGKAYRLSSGRGLVHKKPQAKTDYRLRHLSKHPSTTAEWTAILWELVIAHGGSADFEELVKTAKELSSKLGFSISTLGEGFVRKGLVAAVEALKKAEDITVSDDGQTITIVSRPSSDDFEDAAEPKEELKSPDGDDDSDGAEETLESGGFRLGYERLKEPESEPDTAEPKEALEEELESPDGNSTEEGEVPILEPDNSELGGEDPEEPEEKSGLPANDGDGDGAVTTLEPDNLKFRGKSPAELGLPADVVDEDDIVVLPLGPENLEEDDEDENEEDDPAAEGRKFTKEDAEAAVEWERIVLEKIVSCGAVDGIDLDDVKEAVVEEKEDYPIAEGLEDDEIEFQVLEAAVRLLGAERIRENDRKNLVQRTRTKTY